jgi:uncharacterized repeat protein (TIGR03803 family)
MPEDAGASAVTRFRVPLDEDQASVPGNPGTTDDTSDWTLAEAQARQSLTYASSLRSDPATPGLPAASGYADKGSSQKTDAVVSAGDAAIQVVKSPGASVSVTGSATPPLSAATAGASTMAVTGIDRATSAAGSVTNGDTPVNIGSLTTLVSFDRANGRDPTAGLIADAAGDLFGTTLNGGANDDGTVFEITRTGSGYASTPTTLVSFNSTNGADPYGGLIADAAGDLFGTTNLGGANNDGTVFEIVKTGNGYASTPTTLATFNGTDGALPRGGLIADAHGDLFGTTFAGGASGDGTIFEVVNHGGGSYSLTTLASFNGINGQGPAAGLIADAAGNLFGTTTGGGTYGTVFELAKTGNGYASMPTNLPFGDGSSYAGLIADAAGDLFGTTLNGGANGGGDVFEIPKTGTGYGLLVPLVSFNGADGAQPYAGLVADAAGNLFGTTFGGGANNVGTVFEVVKTGSGYASTPTTLATFSAANGANPYAGLSADAFGNLFGTTTGGGVSNNGTVFELTGAGFRVPANSPPPLGTTADMILHTSDGRYEIYDLGNNAVLAGYPLGQVGADWQFGGLGDFSGGDTTDMILRNANTGAFEVYDISSNNITAAAALGAVGLSWQLAGFGNFNGPGTTTDMMLHDGNTGTFELYDIANNMITGANAIGAVGLDWRVAGFGDFNGDGTTDMMLRNTISGVFEAYDIVGGLLVSATSVGAVGTDWQVAGFADFNGPGTTTGMMLRNTSTGVFELYTINNNQITSASAIGAVGLDWRVAGFGPLDGVGSADMVLRNVNSGTFEVYDIVGGRLAGAAPLGAVGLDWQVGGFAADPPTGAVTSTGGSSNQSATVLDTGPASGDGSGSSTIGTTPHDGTAAQVTDSGPALTSSPTLNTLVSFDGTHGANPYGGLIADAAGNLFGTTSSGGVNDGGTVFEIVKTGAGYASMPTTLASFNGGIGNGPYGSLMADAAGDLFGTTAGDLSGITNNKGAVFLLIKFGAGYVRTTLVSFDGANGANPFAGLIADAAGNLFGTTANGGAHGGGTVFEIVKTGTGYASTPTTLVSFDSNSGINPGGSLVPDSAGDLFGTTNEGGTYNKGTVFEVVKTGTGYASTPTTLVTFDVANGANPNSAGVISDAAGDLFGTTSSGGANNKGTVFEIVKTGTGYASTPDTLVNFDGAHGANPAGGLTADAAGDLFGTTQFGGTNNTGTVFEIVKTGAGYASTPTLLATFSGANGAYPVAGLTADAFGNLFGTTGSGGTNPTDGTVFELSGSGFQIPPNPPPPSGTTADMILHDRLDGRYEIYDLGSNQILAAALLGQAGTDWQFVGLGNFSGGDASDMILRNDQTGAFEVYDISNNNITTAAALGAVGSNWQLAGFGNFNGPGTTTDMMLRDGNTGTFELYDISNNMITGANAIGAVGLDWHVAGFGDFNGDGTTDMMLRNTTSGSFEAYDIVAGRLVSATSVGAVGNDWQVAGFAEFNGPGTTTGMMLRNTGTGVFELYTINNNQITSANAIGAVGLDWQVAGFGPLDGVGSADMVLRNVNSGAFEVYDIVGGRLAGAAPLGAVGLDWQVGGFAADPVTHSSIIFPQ